MDDSGDIERVMLLGVRPYYGIRVSGPSQIDRDDTELLTQTLENGLPCGQAVADRADEQDRLLAAAVDAKGDLIIPVTHLP